MQKRWPKVLRYGATALITLAVATPRAVAVVSPHHGSILDLQTHKREETAHAGSTLVRLTNLNPAVNAWYLLEFQSGSQRHVYNIENAHPQDQRLHLSTISPGNIVIADYLGMQPCQIWRNGGGPLVAATASRMPYAPLCEARIYVRNAATGHRSTKEIAVDFLRDHVWGGEALTSFFKDTVFKDKYLLAAKAGEATASSAVEGEAGPRPAQVAAGSHVFPTQQLGIRLAGSAGHGVKAADAALEGGHWYPAKFQPGVFVSQIAASQVTPELLTSYPGSVSHLDSVEASALVYLVAFDLNRFNIGYSLGTDHPRLDWSTRVSATIEAGLPGPDGFATAAPLIANGVLNPVYKPNVIATFAGGFKRQHSAFKFGDLAKQNHGSHYGFIEDGVVFSKLQPGLATLFAKNDGSFGMKTWTEADNETVSQMRYARQNGVPIIERLSAGVGRPTPYVADWARGNWSGSADGKFRTLRSGLCLMHEGQQRYLVYAYFSTATPSSMARVFQAYGCEYAMHMDMNAPEHTYMALYHETKTSLAVEHVVKIMGAADTQDGTHTYPRFVTMPDNRDFVFLYKRQGQE